VGDDSANYYVEKISMIKLSLSRGFPAFHFHFFSPIRSSSESNPENLLEDQSKVVFVGIDVIDLQSSSLFFWMTVEY
jgi:hypothetical protein